MTGPSVVHRLLSAPEAAITVLRDEGALDSDGLDALLADISRLAASDPRSALVLLELVPDLAGAADAPAAVPAATYLRARMTLDAGEPRAALHLIETAHTEYLRLGMDLPALRTGLGRMHVLDDLGRHTDAVNVGEDLLAVAQTLPGSPELDILHASVQGNIGAALGYLGRHQEALAAYRRSEATWRSFGRLEEAAAALANQGVELTALGRPGAAIDCLDAAAAVFDAAHDRAWYAKCLGHRGEALTAAGWLTDALADYEKARSILDELDARTEAWRLATSTASALLGLGLTDEAITVIDATVPGLREADLQHDLAAALSLRGVACARSGLVPAARGALTEAVRLFRSVADTPGLARALLELSTLVEDTEARRCVGEAADLLPEGHWPGIACLVALRRAELDADDAPGAEEALREASARADELALPHLRQVVSLRLGTRLLRLGDIDGGIEHLTHALAEVEQIGSRIHDDGLRATYLASRNGAQDALIAALLRRGGDEDVNRACALADRAKGRTLIDVMTGTIARPPTVESDGEAARLTGELQAAYSALFAADAGAYPTLRATVAELERLISVRQALSAVPQRAGRHKQAGPDPLAGIPVLAYHLIGEDLVAFVTVGGRLEVRTQVSLRAPLMDLLDDLDAHLGAHAIGALEQFPAARADACRRVLQDLYLAVFAPIAPLLRSRDAAPTPLVIVPHGPLHRVPFHALHDGWGYLLRDWIITVSPSVEVARVSAGRPSRRRPALVVGVADEATPMVEAEARGISAELAGAELLIGPEATFDRVRAGAGEAGVVHLACHGLFRAENVAFTSFRLADRWVRAADVARFDVPGATLVLSACESGRVGRMPGDEAAGLARGFLVAGARCVVLSQWLAHDRGTAELMLTFHRHLAAGADPAAALRLAQLAALETYPHPFHWAPFIAVGAPATLEDS